MTSESTLSERPLYEQVAERLRSRILSHQLAPGSWIDEQVLVQDYGISRTPLREALKVLASEGLVTIRPRRGAYVTEVSEQDVAQVYHLLTLLESDAAATVARCATDAELQELAEIHSRLAAATGDRELFFRLNEAFHLRVLELTGNRWQLETASDLRRVMKLSRHQSLFRQGRIDASLAEHAAILQALQARDAARAHALTAAHFHNGLLAARPGQVPRPVPLPDPTSAAETPAAEPVARDRATGARSA